MRRSSPSRRSSAAGFTLVELLAVIAILGLLFGLAIPIANRAFGQGEVTGCQSNLRNIALSLKVYVDSRNKGKWPKERGVHLLLLPVYKDEISGKDLEIYVCQGTNDTTWPTEDQKGEYGAGFINKDDLDLDCISYAGRDAKEHPIRKDKLGEVVIAADDNDGRPNHKNVTNIVFADGGVAQVDLSDWKDELEEGAEWVPVGPDSPHEDLQKLLVDF